MQLLAGKTTAYTVSVSRDTIQPVCRLAKGVSLDDLAGQQVRQQFRSMCSALVDAIAAVLPADAPTDMKGFEVLTFTLLNHRWAVTALHAESV